MRECARCEAPQNAVIYLRFDPAIAREARWREAAKKNLDPRAGAGQGVRQCLDRTCRLTQISFVYLLTYLLIYYLM